MLMVLIMIGCAIMIVGYFVFFSIFSRGDDLKYSSHLYKTRHRVARRMAGVVVVRRD